MAVLVPTSYPTTILSPPIVHLTLLLEWEGKVCEGEVNVLSAGGGYIYTRLLCQITRHRPTSDTGDDLP